VPYERDWDPVDSDSEQLDSGFRRSDGFFNPSISCIGEHLQVSVGPQMVDFGSEQGLSDFETAVIAGYVEE